VFFHSQLNVPTHTLFKSNFQKELDEIINTFKEFVEVMLSSDSPKVVKKALLSDISTLCMFFGQEKTTDILLPLITSCLDARDWELKGIFFENIVGVSTVAGAGAIESFILPSLLLPEIYGMIKYHFKNLILLTRNLRRRRRIRCGESAQLFGFIM